MKHVLGLAVSSLVAAATSWAGSPVWTNAAGSGKWSDAGNWMDAALPQPGDTVYISNNVANAEIVVDVPVTVASIRFEGLQSPVLRGEKLTLTGTTFSMATPNPRPVVNGTTSNNLRDYTRSVAPILGYYAGATIYNDVEFASTGTTGVMASEQDFHFYGEVTAPDATAFYVHNGIAEEQRFNWNLAHPEKNTDVYFHGPVEAPKAVVQSSQAPSGQIVFEQPLVAKKVGTTQWMSTDFVFKAPFEVQDPVFDFHYLACIRAGAPDVLPANLVFWPRLNNNASSGTKGLSLYLGANAQTIDRLAGDLHGAGKYDKNGNVYGTAPLTLKGTADAVTPLRISDSVSIVWDPSGAFTQAFTGRVHTTTGILSVRGGTLKLLPDTSFANVSEVKVGAGATFDDASTLAGSLAAAGRMTLGAGATLKFGPQAATPFSGGKTELRLDAGARIEVASGVTAAVKNALYDGQPVAPGSYTKAGGCAWVDGAGTVVVAEAMPAGTYWLTGSGDWNDAANWSDGVPSATRRAVVYKSGTRTITIDREIAVGDIEIAGDGNATTLAVEGSVSCAGGRLAFGAGSVLKIVEGGSFVYSGDPDAVAATECVTLADGAKIRVEGGLCSFTNMTGKVVFGSVGGSSAMETGLEVTGGRFAFVRSGDAAHGGVIKGYAGAVLAASAGEVSFGSWNTAGWVFATDGDSRLDQRLSGSAVVRHHNLNASGSNFSAITLPPGRTRVSGSARIETARTGGKSIRVYDRVRGSVPIEAVFEDDAATGPLGLGDDGYYLVGVEGVPATLLWNSAKTGYLGNGSVLYHNAHLKVTKGVVKSGSYGITVGWNNGDKAYLEVDGGCFHNVANFRKQGLDGLILGYGLNQTSGTRYGELVLRSGAVSNTASWSLNLGMGCGATGVFRQLGGELVTTATRCPTTVGMCGGTGDWRMEGGTAYLAGDLWIGGCPVGVFNETFVDWSNLPVIRCPRTDGLGATGALVVAGGEMTVAKTVFVGAGDNGTLGIGNGSLTVNDLVLSNATTSVLSFAPKGATAGKLTVQGRLTVVPGSKLVVDARAFTPAKACTPILVFGEAEGGFAPEDVELLKDAKSRLTLIARPHDYALYEARGTVLVLR